MELFSNLENEKRTTIGKTEVSYKKAASILTEASGFMDSYDYTLNPYSGCSFGCTYCYAAFFARTELSRNNWGYWVQVKENALELLMKWRKKSLNGKTVYMSSVTDPYQPIERDIEITKNLLIELSNFHPDVKLVIQTRSPISTRDIHLFKRFKNIQVNMTVTTDSEDVRKIFEPLCPSNTMRLNAIKEIHLAGVNTCITLTPLLPVEDADEFAKQLLATGIKKYIIQPFHSEKGKFVASTREKALELTKKMNWNTERYNEVFETIRKYIPEIGIGKEGFKAI